MVEMIDDRKFYAMAEATIQEQFSEILDCLTRVWVWDPITEDYMVWDAAPNAPKEFTGLSVGYRYWLEVAAGCNGRTILAGTDNEHSLTTGWNPANNTTGWIWQAIDIPPQDTPILGAMSYRIPGGYWDTDPQTLRGGDTLTIKQAVYNPMSLQVAVNVKLEMRSPSGGLVDTENESFYLPPNDTGDVAFSWVLDENILPGLYTANLILLANISGTWQEVDAVNDVPLFNSLGAGEYDAEIGVIEFFNNNNQEWESSALDNLDPGDSIGVRVTGINLGDPCNIRIDFRIYDPDDIDIGGGSDDELDADTGATVRAQMTRSGAQTQKKGSYQADIVMYADDVPVDMSTVVIGVIASVGVTCTTINFDVQLTNVPEEITKWDAQWLGECTQEWESPGTTQTNEPLTFNSVDDYGELLVRLYVGDTIVKEKRFGDPDPLHIEVSTYTVDAGAMIGGPGNGDDDDDGFWDRMPTALKVAVIPAVLIAGAVIVGSKLFGDSKLLGGGGGPKGYPYSPPMRPRREPPRREKSLPPHRR